jgi:hypothetical protein
MTPRVEEGVEAEQISLSRGAELASTPTSPKSAGHALQDSPTHPSERDLLPLLHFPTDQGFTCYSNPDFGEVGVPGS